MKSITAFLPPQKPVTVLPATMRYRLFFHLHLVPADVRVSEQDAQS